VSVERMTYGQAKAKLRRYYLMLEIAGEFKLGRGDILVAVGRGTGSKSSPQEAEVVRRVDFLASVADSEHALMLLTKEQRRFAELRYRQEWSLRVIARALHRALGAMPQFERDALAAFIAALGKIPYVPEQGE